jgi:ketosteroid isomerase-like protein
LESKLVVSALQDPLEPLREWFRVWGGYVSVVDFNSARALFDADVASFGTHAEVVFGLDRLVAQQWSAVWPNIADFRFVVEKLHGGIAGDYAWAAVPWTSTGFHTDGTPFERPGRATVTFRRDGERWLGVHTHFSLKPGTPPRTYGRRQPGA